jgi:protein-S-isoprenylcysteine O-methyltransferase Ste14
MKHYKKWSSREYPLPVRLFALLVPGVLLVILIPYLLLVSFPRLDFAIGLPHINLGIGNSILGAILVTLGVFFAWWSIGIQLFKAKGTPLPVMPTQSLLTSGPFQYCRNPMTLGTILAYFGVSFWSGSIFSFILVILIATLLILYLKKVEEPELEMRFGQEYLEYKKGTPFLIPRIPGKLKD